MSRERNDFPVLPIPTSIGAGNGTPSGKPIGRSPPCSGPRTRSVRTAGRSVGRGSAGYLSGLLVANTFHRRQSLAERDRSVDPGVTRWAAQAHVMIVRTLDLVRLKVLKQYESPSHRRVRDGHKVQGEWYEVTDQLDSQVHPS
jgi:hypothetical protein